MERQIWDTRLLLNFFKRFINCLFFWLFLNKLILYWIFIKRSLKASQSALCFNTPLLPKKKKTENNMWFSFCSAHLTMAKQKTSWFFVLVHIMAEYIFILFYNAVKISNNRKLFVSSLFHFRNIVCPFNRQLLTMKNLFIVLLVKVIAFHLKFI